jgi:hypothetical protein
MVNRQYARRFIIGVTGRNEAGRYGSMVFTYFVKYPYQLASAQWTEEGEKAIDLAVKKFHQLHPNYKYCSHGIDDDYQLKFGDDFGEGLHYFGKMTMEDIGHLQKGCKDE